MNRLVLTKQAQRDIERHRAAITQHRNAIEAIEGPVELALAQSFVGLHFKFENSYGGERPKRWYGYVKVLRLDKDGNLQALRFESRPDIVQVVPSEWIMVSTLQGYEVVSPEEFAREWQKLWARMSTFVHGIDKGVPRLRRS